MSGLTEMRPVPAEFYVADHAEAYAVPGRQVSVWKSAPEYLQNLFVSKLGVGVMRPNHRQDTSLLGLIGGIIRIRAKEKVSWVAARWIVAVMQDFHIPLPTRVRQRVCDPMGIVHFAVPHNSSVAIRIPTSYPLPTIVGLPLIYVRPKVFSSVPFRHRTNLINQSAWSNQI